MNVAGCLNPYTHARFTSDQWGGNRDFSILSRKSKWLQIFFGLYNEMYGFQFPLVPHPVSFRWLAQGP